MTLAGCAGLLAAALFTALLPAQPPLAAERRGASSEGILSLDYEGGLVSLRTQDAQLGKVLEELGSVADFSIQADGPLQGSLTVYIEKQPPDLAVKKILRGKDVTLLYAAVTKGKEIGQCRLKEVRVFLPEGAKGEEPSRSFRPQPQAPEPPRPSLRNRPRPTLPRAPPPPTEEEARPSTPPPPPPGEAERFVSGLMEGNFDALNEVAERIKQENPEAREQINQFMESLEDAKQRAADGNPVQSLQGLGNLGVIMNEMMKQRE